MAVAPINNNRPVEQPKAEPTATPAGGPPKTNTAARADGFGATAARVSNSFLGGPIDKLKQAWEFATQKVGQLKELAKSAQGVPVNDAQRAELDKVFKGGLDIDSLRIVKGPKELFDNLPRETPAFTVGNKIIVNPNYYPPANDLLVHEATHSWQAQRGGMDYLPQALAAQYVGEGYDYQKGIKEGRSWEQLNPEQQAELIQEAYQHGVFNDPPGTLTNGSEDYTAFAKNAQEELKNGRGASKTWDISKIGDWVEDKVNDVKKDLKKLWPF